MSSLTIINFCFVRCLELSPLHVINIHLLGLRVILSSQHQFIQPIFLNKKNSGKIIFCEVLRVVLLLQVANFFHGTWNNPLFTSSIHSISVPYYKDEATLYVLCLKLSLLHIITLCFVRCLELSPASLNQNLGSET